MKNVMYGKTKVVISADNAALGRDSASMVAMQMRELLKKQNVIRMVCQEPGNGGRHHQLPC
jgi:hypothetical protein